MVLSVMPASLQPRDTMNGGPASHLDDQRAYQLALELSMLGLGNGNNSNVGNQYHNHHPQSVSSHQNYDGYREDHSDQLHQEPYYQADNHYNSHGMANLLIEPPGPGFDDQMFGNGVRKSANMTETVPVPSSEHVAEIVGRQGCKIKALRAKTNTYIKTPVRGAEPVFVVTGRQEDVAQAKQEILSAADHFSQIRASRRNGSAGSQASNSSGTASPTSTPGHVTLQVRVPYKVVGLVVGPKGATIKRIQQMTSTYIVTPGRDKEPVFEVTGLPDSVEKAREEIEKHIASRTGTDNNSDLQIDDFNINGIDSGFHDQSGDSTTNNYSNTNGYSNNIVNQHDNLPPLSALNGGTSHHHNNHHYKPVCSTQLNQPSSSAHLNANMKISEYSLPPQYTNNYGSGFNRNPDYEVDEGIGTSGGSIFDPSAIWSDASYGVQRSHSISVTSSRILPPGEDGPHPRTRRTNSDPLAAAFQRIDAAFSSSSPTSSQGSMSPVTGRRNASPPRPKPPTAPRDCLLCGACDVNAALVPCGHNSFCMGCANEICRREAERRLCPICHEVPSQAILIRNC